MARREDEFYRRGQNPDDGDASARRGVAVSRRADTAGPADDDEIERRAVDLDEAEDSPFLRGQKRVPVRRGPVTKKAASRIKLAARGVSALIPATTWKLPAFITFLMAR